MIADLSVDVRDAVGDRLHISDEFKKDGVRPRPLPSLLPPSNSSFPLQTTFEIGQAQRLQYLPPPPPRFSRRTNPDLSPTQKPEERGRRLRDQDDPRCGRRSAESGLWEDGTPCRGGSDGV